MAIRPSRRFQEPRGARAWAAARNLIVAAAICAPAFAGAMDKDWTMTGRTPLGDAVLINQNQLDRNGAALIAMVDAPSRDHIFIRAIEHLEGGTRSPPSDAILRADAGSTSAFFKWWYDTAADRPFAERVIRMGGAHFAGQIEAQLRNSDDMIRIEMLRTILQSQGKVKVASGALDSLLSDPSPDVQLLA